MRKNMLSAIWKEWDDVKFEDGKHPHGDQKPD